MNLARRPEELSGAERAVAIGTFDGVHLGHRRVVEGLVASGLVPTVLTFDPHPRRLLGYRVELICTVERRLELLAEAGVQDVLMLEFTLEMQRLEPGEFVAQVLEPIGTKVVVVGPDFHFGHHRRGTVEYLTGRGYEVRGVPAVQGVSSTQIRQLVQAGHVVDASRSLGRPVEVEGIVVEGDARGGTLGFPTANLDVPPDLLCPGYGIYAGAARDFRAAVSIGTNPHYGGAERRIEAFLLDFHGDLYGERLVVELWSRLRDEGAFSSEQELIDQIALDVEQTRLARRPL